MGESRRPENGVCQRFTGLRQWGIGPAEPWRICQNCGWPKAQHELPSCPGVLMIADKDYPCELNHPHQGWGCSNKEAQAIWTSNPGTFTTTEVKGDGSELLPTDSEILGSLKLPGGYE